MRNAILTLLAFTLLSTVASAASRQDVAVVAEMVGDTTVPALLRKQRYIGDEYMGDVLVIIEEGKRYTFLYRVEIDDPKSTVLDIWVRPDGTTAERDLNLMIDSGIDGEVDVGNGFLKPGLNYGEAWTKKAQDYWQVRYDAAITAALQYKKRMAK